MRTTNIITKEDIDLEDKLDNMLESEISEDVYNKCNEPKTFEKIEKKIWNMINDKKLPYYYLEWFEHLGKTYLECEGYANKDDADEHDFWSACFYNCDLIYMQAIAYILGLEIPNDSGDIDIFGMD